MKTILITGTTAGFGKEIAKILHQKGYNVIGTSRNIDNVSAPYHMVNLNVDSDESVQKAIQYVKENFGSIDVLVNNAGYGLCGSIEDISIEEAKAQMETNFFGVVRMTKAVLPLMRENGGGKIINISSMAGFIGLPFMAYYSTSKFALEGFVEAVRLEVKPFNIQVTNINPGHFKTEFTGSKVTSAKISSPYKNRVEQSMKVYDEAELSGPAPKIMAEFVVKIIEKTGTLKVGYSVGNFLDTKSVIPKKILGREFFQWAFQKVYRF